MDKKRQAIYALMQSPQERLAEGLRRARERLDASEAAFARNPTEEGERRVQERALAVQRLEALVSQEVDW